MPPPPSRVDLAVAARPLLVRYAVRLTGDVADAEDLVHDAYVRTLPILDRLDSDTAVLPMMYRILRNRQRDLVRRAALVRFDPLPERWAGVDAGRGDDATDGAGRIPDALIERETPEHHVLTTERARLVRAIVAGLPAGHRTALHGRYVEDDPWYRTHEAGKARTHRARRWFRAEWERVA